jgi:hypothetical protein
MTAPALMLDIACYGCATIGGAALVAFGLRRWHLAAALGRTATIAAPVLFAAASVVGFVVAERSGVDPTMKATALSKGISEILNCAAFTLVATFPGAIIWRAARRRARATTRPR